MRDGFLLDPQVTHLNHGSFGACPVPVFEEYQALQRELESGPTDCVESLDCEGDPARARLLRVRLDEERGVLVDVPQHLIPERMSAGRPKNRVYQSMLASRSDTGTPATS